MKARGGQDPRCKKQGASLFYAPQDTPPTLIIFTFAFSTLYTSSYSYAY